MLGFSRRVRCSDGSVGPIQEEARLAHQEVLLSPSKLWSTSSVYTRILQEKQFRAYSALALLQCI
jgi:hypothetical protein